MPRQARIDARPASPELAMAGRRREPCIISYAGVSSDETFVNLKTY